MAKKLLIVGAGITGSLTAALLSRLPVISQKLAITLWDKDRGAGGRMSTHQYQNLHVDMGGQYVTHFKTEGCAEYEELKDAIYEELLSNKILVPFVGKIEKASQTEVNVAGGTQTNSVPILQNYVAPDGLSAMVKHFLKNSVAKTSFQHQISQINVKTTRDKTKGKSSVECKTSTESASFDAVILTMPVPQILALDGNFMESLEPEVKSNLAKVQYPPRYALGLLYDPSTVAAMSTEVFDLGWSAKYFDDPIVSYASWDLSKRGADLNNGRALLVHTSVPFGIEHIDTDKEDVKVTMMQKVNELIPGLPKPDDSNIVRWRYPRVSQPYPGSPGYVILSRDPLVVATGDGLTGPGFENCLKAAQATTKLFETRY